MVVSLAAMASEIAEKPVQYSWKENMEDIDQGPFY